MTGSLPRPSLAAFLVVLATLALALPAAASAATEFPLEVEVTGEGFGNVGCKANAGPVEGCEAEFPEGTKVTVIAEPQAGSELLEWQGDCDSTTGNECKVEMDEAKTIEAVFELEGFELEVDTTGSGEGIVECEVEFGPTEPCPPGETYPYGSEVTLYAEPEEGSEFSEWGGDCSGTEPECTLSVEEALSVTADFEPGPLFALNIEEPGTGEGTIACEVDAGPAEPCQAEYPQGADVKMLAKALPGSEFTEWGGECDVLIGNECALTMNEEKTVEVTFKALPLVSLTLNLAGSGEGKVECKVNGSAAKACVAEYPEGTELALVAVAKEGSKFASYSAGTGSATACTTSPCTFTITANSKVTATFSLAAKFALKVKKTGTGTGKVESTSPLSPKISCGTECEKEFDEGTKVTLAQSAEAGSTFVKWSGACSGSGACEVTISAAKEVTAEFALKAKFALKVKNVGTGTGTVTSTPAGVSCSPTCSAEFEEGKVVELKQSATAGSEFVKWTGACTGSGTCKVTMSAAKEVTAEFNLKAKPEFKLTIAKAGTGSGSVTCNATTCASTYPEGTEVTLAATAASGSTFAGWSGGGCSGTGACKVTIGADTTVTATFDASQAEKTCANTPSLCPPPPPPAVEQCIVPKLAKKTLGQAKAALKAAHCALGKVSKPKKKKGALVVKSSSPGAGKALAAGAKVGLKLGPKPKKKH